MNFLLSKWKSYLKSRKATHATSFLLQKVVGSWLSITCEMLFGQCKSFMVIEDVVVDESFHRKGIGAAIMMHIEQHAKENNCSISC